MANDKKKKNPNGGTINGALGFTGARSPGTGVGGVSGTVSTVPPPEVQQLINLNKLYRQTFQTGIQNTRRKLGNAQDQAISDSRKHMPGPGGVVARLFGVGGSESDDRTNQLDTQLNRLMERKQNGMPILRKLSNFAQAQGFEPSDINQTLQQYLSQEAALSRFMPRHYVAPTKQDLLGAVNAGAPKWAEARQQEEINGQLAQYLDFIRTSAQQSADADYDYMLRKASTVKDPDQQAQAIAAAEQLYSLKKFQIDAMAEDPFGPNDNSVASVLGAYNAGNKKNVNNLYGGTSSGSSNSSGSQAIDDDFIAQILAGQ